MVSVVGVRVPTAGHPHCDYAHRMVGRCTCFVVSPRGVTYRYYICEAQSSLLVIYIYIVQVDRYTCHTIFCSYLFRIIVLLFDTTFYRLALRSTVSSKSEAMLLELKLYLHHMIGAKGRVDVEPC